MIIKVSEYINYMNFYKNFLWEDLIVVLLLYNFFKFLIMCAMTELIWPTQYFNRKHSIGYQTIKFRTYTETLLKLRNVSIFTNVFNLYLLVSNFILKK